MGLEIVLGAVSLAVGVISGVNQMNAAAETKRATERAIETEKKAVAADKESRDIQMAQQRIIATEDRRQRVREERIRRAAMQSAAQATGGSGSSGESGSISALGANFGTLIGQQRSQTRANEGMNLLNQKALDLRTESDAIMSRARANAAQADAFSSFLGVFSDGINSFR